MADLVELFSKIPGFAWAKSDDGQRTMGTTEGFVLDLWPDRVEAVALFPPDRDDLAARNGTLFQLLLMAMRPDWATAPAWLAQQMRLVARSKSPRPEMINVARRVTLTWDSVKSRATLKVMI
jgi:hypothetical protein